MGFSNVVYTDARIESLIAELRPKFERAQEVALLAKESFGGKKNEPRVIHVGRRDLDFMTGESTWVPLCASRSQGLSMTSPVSSASPSLPSSRGLHSAMGACPSTTFRSRLSDGMLDGCVHP
jgi:hypothetical protein